MQVRIFNNERMTNQKKLWVSLYQYMKLHFTLVFKSLSSNCMLHCHVLGMYTLNCIIVWLEIILIVSIAQFFRILKVVAVRR